MDKGGLSASAGTRKFEYVSESVLDLNVPPDEFDDQSYETPVTVTIQKNRNGTRGKKIDLMFHGALQRFREV
jgi:replicative DNA helicase